MIKGINKQIIEIRCADDRYFEKALLFVRADKCSQPHELLERYANELCENMTNSDGQHRRRHVWKIILLSSLPLIAAAVGFAVFAMR